MEVMDYNGTEVVVRCKEGKVVMQPKDDYIEELEQKIDYWRNEKYQNYKEQCSIVRKAKKLDKAGNKYEALQLLDDVHFCSYNKDTKAGITKAVDCNDLNNYRESLFLDLANDLFHKHGYDKYELSIEDSTWEWGCGRSTRIDGVFGGPGCIVNYGKAKYFLPVYGLDEVKNLKRHRVLTEMEYPDYGSYNYCYTYKYSRKKEKELALKEE